MSARRLLQLLLLAQAGVAGALAWAALRWGAVAAPAAALVLGCAAVLLARLLIGAGSFALSAHYASATPPAFRLGAVAALRLFGAEFLSSMLYASWYMPAAAPRQRIHRASGQLPVLLLHGYGCNSGYWVYLTRLLDAAHISHATLDLEPLNAAIDDYVPAVARAAEALCAASGAPQLTMVCHSMGGLVARAYLRAHGGARVAAVITLGTPHQGTCLARWGIGRNAAQMRRDPGNDWLGGLAASESAATRVLVTALYTHHDNIVSPQSAGLLPGARNVGIGGVGHVALGRDRRVLAFVMRELAGGRRADGFAGAASGRACSGAFLQEDLAALPEKHDHG